uniref:UDP-glycosyltransferases domain-containing protein n=1 Tax=Glossina austeni TaxID=7395 RepID=A0A1A9VTL8_GLOAU
MLRAGILISFVLSTAHLSRYGSVVYGANILGIFLTNSPSHLIVHMSVAKVLAEEGHNVTVLVTQESKVNHQKIHIILIPPAEEHIEFLHKEFSGLTKQKPTLLRTLTNVIGSLRLLIDMQKDALEDERFTQLYDNPDTKFDLVIVGYFLNSFQLGVAAKFKVPVVLSWMSDPGQLVNDYVGNPNEIAYVPNMNLALKPGEKMNFLKRLENFLTSVMIGVFKGIIDYRNQRLYKELFTNDAGIRSYHEMKQNVSLVFCNSHFTEGSIRPNVPAVIEIGGIQIKEQPDLLPEDISAFLNKSKVHGAVLFCLGSSFKTEYIKPEITETIFQVLSNLKQNVIWKWDDLTNTPGISKNIIYKQWIPQDDILAHPNLKLFITHAGKGGVAEAQYHGVPMVALPAFADQPGNAAKMVVNGYGLQLDLLTLTDNQLRGAIHEVLTDPSYRENVQQFSRLYRDRPLTARQSVAFWTNYVIRNHGAAHMQSSLVHMNFIESLNIDVIVFLLIVSYVLYKIFNPSHLIVHMSVVKVLAEEGHNVTVFVTQEPKVNHQKIHTIIIPPGEEHIEILHKEFSDLAKEKPSVLRTLRNLIGSLRLLIDMQKDALEDKRFTQLYDNPDTKFDLVIVGYFLNSFQLGVAAKFNAPVILSWMSAPIQIINNYVGNPNGIAYVPNTMLATKLGEKMNFLERVENFMTAVMFDIFGKIMDYRNQRFYNELFPNPDGKFPTYQEMKNNVSLVFCNSHFPEGPIRPNVPAYSATANVNVTMLRQGILIFAFIESLSWLGCGVDGGNILGVFLTHRPSHLIVHMSVAKVLAEEGHNVTVVVTQIPKVNHKGINIVLIPPVAEKEASLHKGLSELAKKRTNFLSSLQKYFSVMRLLNDMEMDALQDERFAQLYVNPDTKFDLVVLGYCFNSFQFGVAAKFKTPLMLSWMFGPAHFINGYVGNPNEIAYVPHMNMAFEAGKGMNFAERLQNFLGSIITDILHEILDYCNQGFYKQLFPNDGIFPTYQEMKNNVSLIFCNSHFTEGPIRPNVPAVVEIGGIQVKDRSDPLPEDISSFLDESKIHGAILFCLGSGLISDYIKPEVIKTVFQVLSSLKQNVIWKWDDLTNTPGNSKNIMYKQWIPQDDILAHPNLKLFITHAGKGGVAEAQYHGVPMVALPLFGDQDNNAAKVVTSGYGLELDVLNLTNDQLRFAINEVLINPFYRENVQQFSRLYRDRPLTARQSVAFWTNYVIRNHGAAHMQSPLVHMNFIQSLNIDVIASLGIISYIIYKIFILLACYVLSKILKNFPKSNLSSRKKKKNQ